MFFFCEEGREKKKEVERGKRKIFLFIKFYFSSHHSFSFRTWKEKIKGFREEGKLIGGERGQREKERKLLAIDKEWQNLMSDPHTIKFRGLKATRHEQNLYRHIKHVLIQWDLNAYTVNNYKAWNLPSRSSANTLKIKEPQFGHPCHRWITIKKTNSNQTSTY